MEILMVEYGGPNLAIKMNSYRAIKMSWDRGAYINIAVFQVRAPT
jgi:hypothetical protein